MEWLLILGAGASMAAPSCIPGFDQLRNEILRAIGWEWDPDVKGWVREEPIHGYRLPPLVSARLTTVGAPPEVVFGTMHRFGIPFASQVESALLAWEPTHNAVHAAAAAALRRGWPVWTPNIDIAIESAYGASEPARLVVGARDRDGTRRPVDVSKITAATLLKFHGSADLPGSLAFTDLELLAPYRRDEVRHLAAVAGGRRVILYGYRGADADLHDAIAAAIDAATDVQWYEPDPAIRMDISRVFGPRVEFDPPHLPDDGRDFAANVNATAEAFVAAAAEAGLLDDAATPLRQRLGVLDRREIQFVLDVPAIVHARLVERFAPKADEGPALAAARRADLLRPRPRAVRAHGHWAVSASLYRDDGVVRRIVGAAARHPRTLAALPSLATRYVYDKGPAILLPSGEYHRLHALASQALARRRRTDPLRRGSDLYYLAHSLRYLNQPQKAHDTLDAAGDLLVHRHGLSDAERYAGVLLERGCIALHQARIGDAAMAAEALISGPGRYAISSWVAWGRWLAAMSRLYATAVHGEVSLAAAADAADEDLRAGEAVFRDADHESGLADLYLVRLLAYRIRLAAEQTPTLPDRPPRLSRRQQQDEHLLMADVAIAAGDLARAKRLLCEVERDPANEIAAAWAALGRAELAAADDPTGAQSSRDRLRAHSEAVGAWWLAAQAALGPARVAQSGGTQVLAVGEPRVLWLVT